MDWRHETNLFSNFKVEDIYFHLSRLTSRLIENVRVSPDVLKKNRSYLSFHYNFDPLSNVQIHPSSLLGAPFNPRHRLLFPPRGDRSGLNQNRACKFPNVKSGANLTRCDGIRRRPTHLRTLWNTVLVVFYGLRTRQSRIIVIMIT